MPYIRLAEQIQAVRRRVNERTAANISDRQIISALNQGAYVFDRDLGVYFEDYYPFYTIAAQQLYSLP